MTEIRVLYKIKHPNGCVFVYRNIYAFQRLALMGIDCHGEKMLYRDQMEPPDRLPGKLFVSNRYMAHAKTSIGQILTQLGAGIGVASLCWYSLRQNKQTDSILGQTESEIEKQVRLLDQETRSNTTASIWKGEKKSDSLEERKQDSGSR
jgi:hypothetical protein